MKILSAFNIAFGMTIIYLITELWHRSKKSKGTTDATKAEAMTMLVCFVGYILSGAFETFYILCQ